jgi:hypothetical protein
MDVQDSHNAELCKTAGESSRSVLHQPDLMVVSGTDLAVTAALGLDD